MAHILDSKSELEGSGSNIVTGKNYRIKTTLTQAASTTSYNIVVENAAIATPGKTIVVGTDVRTVASGGINLSTRTITLTTYPSIAHPIGTEVSCGLVTVEHNGTNFKEGALVHLPRLNIGNQNITRIISDKTKINGNSDIAILARRGTSEVVDTDELLTECHLTTQADFDTGTRTNVVSNSNGYIEPERITQGNQFEAHAQARFTLNEGSGKICMNLSIRPIRANWHGSSTLHYEKNEPLSGIASGKFVRNNRDCARVPAGQDIYVRTSRNVSLSAIIKVEDTNTYNPIIAKAIDANNKEYCLGVTTTGALQFETIPEGQPAVIVTSADNLIKPGIEYYVMAVFSNTFAIAIYINGVLVGSRSSIYSIFQRESALNIGHIPSAGGAPCWFNGLIDRATVWYKTITHNEARELHIIENTPRRLAFLLHGDDNSNIAIIKDDSQNRYHFTYYNGEYITISKLGGRSFKVQNGTTYAKYTGITLKKKNTIAFWLYLNNIQADKIAIIGHNFNFVTNAHKLAVGSLSDSYIKYRNVSFGFDFNNSINLGINSGWHHFVGTSDGYNIRTYLDGVLVNIVSAGDIETENGFVIIGREEGYGYGVNAYLDDVGWWDRAINEEEVKYLYNYGSGKEIPNPVQDLILSLPFNEGSGSIAYDLANNLNATWNTPSWSSTVRFGVSSALLTLSNYMFIPTTTKLDLPSEFTIEVWLRYNASSQSNGATIISHGTGSIDGWTFSLTSEGSGRVYFSYRNNKGVQELYSTSQLTQTGGTYYLVVRLRNNILDIFINNSRNATMTVTGSGGSLPSTSEIRIGRNIVSGNSLRAFLQNLAVWGRGLSNAEIAYNYNSGLGKYSSEDIVYQLGTVSNVYAPSSTYITRSFNLATTAQITHTPDLIVAVGDIGIGCSLSCGIRQDTVTPLTTTYSNATLLSGGIAGVNNQIIIWQTSGLTDKQYAQVRITGNTPNNTTDKWTIRDIFIVSKPKYYSTCVNITTTETNSTNLPTNTYLQTIIFMASSANNTIANATWLDKIMVILPSAIIDQLKLYQSTNNAVQLNWNNAPSGDSIIIQRKIDGDSYSSIATGLSGMTTSYSDATIASNVKYMYKIIPILGNIEGIADERGILTIPDIMPGTIGNPSKPANVIDLNIINSKTSPINLSKAYSISKDYGIRIEGDGLINNIKIKTATTTIPITYPKIIKSADNYEFIIDDPADTQYIEWTGAANKVYVFANLASKDGFTGKFILLDNSITPVGIGKINSGSDQSYYSITIPNAAPGAISNAVTYNFKNISGKTFSTVRIRFEAPNNYAELKKDINTIWSTGVTEIIWNNIANNSLCKFNIRANFSNVTTKIAETIILRIEAEQ